MKKYNIRSEKTLQRLETDLIEDPVFKYDNFFEIDKKFNQLCQNHHHHDPKEQPHHTHTHH